jgi:hypothetical protein
MSARRRAVLITVALTAGVLALALVVPGGAAPEAARASDERAARAFDDVPGMGLSPDAVARDEAISYWEAWRRDVSVQDCMRRAGFVWEPEVAYPAEAVVVVAALLGVTPTAAGDGGATAVTRNARRAAALSPAERERWFQTLLGESAATISFVEQHDGALPPGETAEDFASGGCAGAAVAAVGSVWQLGRRLAADLAGRLRAARATPGAATERNRYERCAAQQGLAGVQDPADVDRALDRSSPQAAAAVDTQCSGIWRQVDESAQRRAAAAVREAHAAAIDRQQRRYADAVPAMRANRDFLRFVAAAAGRG